MADEEIVHFLGYGLEKDMRICRSCGEVTGFVRKAEGGPFKFQCCGCKNDLISPEDYEDLRNYFHLDFGEAVTLCRSCGQILMKSGSKFSPFSCDGCREFIFAFNNYRRFVLVPLGRHSFMNGLRLRGPDVDKPKAVAGFAAGWNSLVDRMELLDEWRKEVIAGNLEAAGLSGEPEIGLVDYLAAMPANWISRYFAFLGLRKFFLDKCGIVPEYPAVVKTSKKSGNRKSAETPPVFRILTDEIGCLACTLVARVEAVESRWPGGLKAYLERYGGFFNRNLVVQCRMNLDFEEQLVGLAEYGLEIVRDFTLFDAGQYIQTDSESPLELPAAWLAGYYKNGHVMVCMKH
jgi:hypothetical protein